MTERLLYLVRHGEYEDDALTEVGRAQSRLVARRLADVPFTSVHHSTVGRAAETASLIAAELPGVPVHSTDLLRECIPQIPANADLTDDLRTFFASLPPDEVAAGPGLARAALDRFAGPDQARRLQRHGPSTCGDARHRLSGARAGMTLSRSSKRRLRGRDEDGGHE